MLLLMEFYDQQPYIIIFEYLSERFVLPAMLNFFPPPTKTSLSKKVQGKRKTDLSSCRSSKLHTDAVKADLSNAKQLFHKCIC